MTPLARQLVGRDTGLRTLERLLEEVRAGEARFVILAGEPGIGKTTLLAEPARRAGELAAAGDHDAAVSMLEQIEDLCAARGAELLRKRATGELRRLGRGRHARPGRARTDAPGLAALSAREREIAVLVRQRQTNPEIAAALFLSPKTVESHLRNIFRKLDVSSRVEVAQLVESEERRSR
jgi:DNA-binding NarL/FixJ family response regulator